MGECMYRSTFSWLRTSWRCVVSFTPRSFYYQYPLDLRLGGTKCQSGTKRKFFTLPGLELRTLGRPARSQSLYRLRYPGFLSKQGWTTYSLSGQIFTSEVTDQQEVMSVPVAHPIHLAAPDVYTWVWECTMSIHLSGNSFCSCSQGPGTALPLIVN
jgi:hypothetical protein